jgi:2-polyprenyl-3-methyl-5-hydroxy-6-metoxy-1,4-benzoquinol methylase
MISDNTTQEKKLFDNYLTEHLGHTINSKTKEKKKQWLMHNYQNLLPQDLNVEILEVGPGYGELLEFLIQDMKYKKVLGVDISPEVVDFCNSTIPGSAELLGEGYEFFENKRNHFDCIIMLHVLEHVPKNQTVALLTALYGSLKPGGLIIVEVPNMANPIVGLNFRYADFTHEVGFTDASLKYVLRKAGFSDISVHSSKVPATSFARKVQHILQVSLGQLISLALKIYIPTSKQITSTAIYALSIKK